MNQEFNKSSKIGLFQKIIAFIKKLRVTKASIGPFEIEVDPEIDHGSHNGSISYEDGDLNDYNNNFLKDLDVRTNIDRLASSTKLITTFQLDFVRVAIDDQKCRWWQIIDKESDAMLAPIYETFKEQRHFYDRAEYLFHQIGSSSDDKRNPDPILDISLVNNSSDTLVVTGIAVAPLAAWCVMKHPPTPSILDSSGTYKIPIDFTKRLCKLEFSEPLVIYSKSPWRFYLHLSNLHSNLNSLNCNECLVSLNIFANSTYIQSNPIYFGVL